MKKIYAILCLLVIGFASCKEEGFDLFTKGDGCYVSFVNSETDTINFSFFSTGPKYDYPVVLQYVGVPEPEGGKAKSYSIKVVDSLTTMDMAYVELPTNLTFQPWSLYDTIYVHLEKYAALDQEDANGHMPVVTLCLELQAGDELQLGDRGYRRITFKISNEITQPAWWNNTVKNNLLGNYTKKKYLLFLEVIEPDLSDTSLQNIQEWAIQFRRYLESQDPPIYEEDGTLMEVKVEA